MATGYIILPIGAAVPPDGSTDNVAAAIARYQGTEASPKKHYLGAAFTGTTSDPDEHLWWMFQLPGNYSSGGTLTVKWVGTSTASGNVYWQARVGAITPADTDTVAEHAQAAAAGQATANDTAEAGRLITTDISLTMDSAAANDLISLCLFRDPDNGSDTYGADAVVLAVVLSYTTT